MTPHTILLNQNKLTLQLNNQRILTDPEDCPKRKSELEIRLSLEWLGVLQQAIKNEDSQRYVLANKNIEIQPGCLTFPLPHRKS